MTMLDWSTSGLGIVSLVSASILYIVFRKKLFGVLDPMAFFIVLRVSPLVAVIVLMMSFNAFTSFYFCLMLVSAIIFVITFWASTPRIEPRKMIINQGDQRGLLQAAIGLIAIKLVIFLISAGPLPIFGDQGSDSYIAFDTENKVGSNFLLSIGSAEVVLLSFLIPLAKIKIRIFLIFILILAALLTLAVGKKSSLLLFFMTVALGEYLRLYYVRNQFYYFLKPAVVLLFFVGIFSWAGWVYSRTSAEVSGLGFDSLLVLLDFIYLQMAYPFFMFASGGLSAFFDVYQVDRLRYFFHTISSLLGYPAFSASIGPALHEFQTGELTGNGVNSTFILEGYILFGFFMPIFSWFIAFILGRIRRFITYLKCLRNKILYSALFLPSIYVLPVDTLLFIKMLLGLILLAPILYLLTWTTKNVR